MKDVVEQYETVAHISDAQLGFLMGVTEFYRARTDTKMTIAAERLAVIAAITLPITSLSSVIGMNVIVNESTRWVPLAILLLIMLAISLTLLRWAHKQGWWGELPQLAAPATAKTAAIDISRLKTASEGLGQVSGPLLPSQGGCRGAGILGS